MKIFARVLLITLGLSCFVPVHRAHAVSISLLGVGDLTSLSHTGFTNASGTELSSSGTFAPGGAVALNFMLIPGLSFEVDGIYFQRKYTLSDPSSTLTGITYANNNVEGAALLRIGLIPFLSLGLGGYYCHAIGNMQDVTDGSSIGYDVAGFTPNDYGGVASVRFSFPIGMRVAVVADARYQLGLSNVVNAPGATASLKYSDFMGLVGLRFGMMGMH
jgi:hypothetical protein